MRGVGVIAVLWIWTPSTSPNRSSWMPLRTVTVSVARKAALLRAITPTSEAVPGPGSGRRLSTVSPVASRSTAACSPRPRSGSLARAPGSRSPPLAATTSFRVSSHLRRALTRRLIRSSVRLIRMPPGPVRVRRILSATRVFGATGPPGIGSVLTFLAFVRRRLRTVVVRVILLVPFGLGLGPWSTVFASGIRGRTGSLRVLLVVARRRPCPGGVIHPLIRTPTQALCTGTVPQGEEQDWVEIRYSETRRAKFRCVRGSWLLEGGAIQSPHCF